MITPSKYDAVAASVRESTGARGVLILILGGNSGDGFAAELDPPDILSLPQILRRVADQLDASGGAYRAQGYQPTEGASADAIPPTGGTAVVE